MNRTKEYMNIIQSSNLPQKTAKSINDVFYIWFETENKVKALLQELEKSLSHNKVYESFMVQSKIEKVQSLLQELKNNLNVELNHSNHQEEESYNNMMCILKNRICQYSLKLKGLTNRKAKRNFIVEERRKQYSSVEIQEQESLVEKESNTLRNRDRERISNQISEIGQIMEEIGMHVSLQEESFKRIDDLMETSDKFLDTSVLLLKKTYSNITGTRSAIVKFFSFWVVLVLFFWILRKL